MARNYEHREIRLVIEYVMRRWPGRRFITEYRLLKMPRAIPEGMSLLTAARMYAPANKWVDALVWDRAEVWLIEGKTDNFTYAIGQLQIYKKILDENREMNDIGDVEIKPLLLMARRDIDVESFARSVGIDIAVFQPDWLRPFMTQGYVNKYART